MEGLPSIADILSLPCGGAHEAAEVRKKKKDRKDKQKKYKKKHKKEQKKAHKDKKKVAFEKIMEKMGTPTQEEIDHFKLHLGQFGTQAAAAQQCSWCCWILHSPKWKE